ncbi:ABC transporter permease [candidate division TA06 bacterium DG_24]|uniref:ABC transporter permease n=3 Tax=Bacteria division TA06 TaxID=1156500 RepID=A0A0S8JIG8_UNCT6|nr:MAG: ABC transporter permease [candidate division TA06 bacterium DG_24]KPK68193.1 MAG: ABC transporter permease [candidate division TA06 bacterium SM23_40]KPL09464.1 MAG: ABC transporter permease [candidate division TA06 bacterium SM1_40]
MRGHTLSELREGYSFMLPLIVFLGCFVLLPVVGTFVTSVYQDVTFLERKFILFQNYRRLIGDADFWRALRFTLLFVAVSVPLEMLLGLSFALLLNQSVPLRGLLRCCVLIPWAIPAAISGRTWELIYNYNYGLANFLLARFGLSDEPINWLGSSAGAFASVVLSDAWKTTPFIAIILLAGLSVIPSELYRQAKVDGANFLYRFYRITVPLLKPTIIVALLFRTIDALRIFDLIYVLTHGGPGGATTSLSLYGYRYFLVGDFGYGSSISVTLFVIALVLALIYVRLSRWSTELT